MGKTADLAFGYAGGIGAYRAMDKRSTLTDDEINRHKNLWREQHPAIVNLWKTLNDCAVKAVETGCTVKVNKHLSFRIDGDFLKQRLPSGREISYPFQRLIMIEKPSGGHSPAVSFMDNTKGKWTETRNGRGMYGGVWFNNVVQGTARDVLAAAMLRLDAAEYRIVVHVHDQVAVEMPIGADDGE